MIQVIANGTAQRYEAPLALAALLERMSLAGKTIAAESNREILPKSAHPHTLIGDGDRLEVIVAVGGG